MRVRAAVHFHMDARSILCHPSNPDSAGLVGHRRDNSQVLCWVIKNRLAVRRGRFSAWHAPVLRRCPWEGNLR
jgi:hypothetical protein